MNGFGDADTNVLRYRKLSKTDEAGTISQWHEDTKRD